MAAYPGMMPHMVAAPEDNVVPYLDKGLDGVVLKDKCVFPNVVQGNKARGMRTNIFGQAVPLFLGLVELCLPHTVNMRITNRQKHLVFFRRIYLFYRFKVTHRKAAETVLRLEGPVHRKCGHLVIRIPLEHEFYYLGHVVQTKNNQFFHRISSPLHKIGVPARSSSAITARPKPVNPYRLPQ